MTIASLNVRIGAITTGLQQGLKGAGGLLARFQGGIAGGALSLARFAAGAAGLPLTLAAVGSSLLNLGHAAAEGSAEMERTEIRLGYLIGSMETAKQWIDSLESQSFKLGIDPDQFVGAGTQLLRFGMGLGETNELMGELANISAVTKTPLEELANIIGRAAQQGSVSGKVLSQLAKSQPELMGAMREVTGVGVLEFQRLAAEGKISFDVLRKGIASLGGKGGKWAGAGPALAEGQIGSWDRAAKNMSEVIEKTWEASRLGKVWTWVGDQIAAGAERTKERWFGAAEQLSQATVEMEALRKKEKELEAASAELRAEIVELEDSLRKKMATLGMSEDQVKDYELAVRGATAAELAQVAALRRQVSEQAKRHAWLKRIDEAGKDAYQDSLRELVRLKDTGQLSVEQFGQALSLLDKEHGLGKLTEDIAEVTAEVEKAIATFGMSAHESRVWELQQKGATAEQLAGLRERQRHLERLEAAREQEKELLGLATGKAPAADWEQGTAAENLASTRNEARSAGAMAWGSREAYSTIVQHQIAASRDPVEKLLPEAQGHRKVSEAALKELQNLPKNLAQSFTSTE